MPLSPLQRRVMAAIAAQRDPESYIAGAAALQRHGIRGSADIDIFHDREEALDRAVAADSAALRAAGFDLAWERQAPAIYRALVRDAGEATRLEWVIDSDFRFFPTQPDEEFGYVLHPLDLATNKILAGAGRLVAALPRGLAYGALLRTDGSLAHPDPDRPETLAGLVVHHGSRKGSWPSSPEIGAAMLRERPLPR